MLRPVTSLADLALLAAGSTTQDLSAQSKSYTDLAIRSAENLGGSPGNLREALKWLELCAFETSEEGVVDEVNFCI